MEGQGGAGSASIPFEAVYSSEGQQQIRELSDYYLANAALIRTTLSKAGFKCIGGDHAPYVWVKANMDSWKFFDIMLQKASVVCTPGAGFGKCGEGYIRFSAFNSHENVVEALQRVSEALKGL